MATDGLDFSSSTDFENAGRGLVDRLDPCVVTTADGRVVWDNDRWGFLQGECPETVNPSLWRQGQLCAQQGLFEVTEGIYQVRGLDVSNMTIIEGAEGIVVVDPLVSKETAAAALALYRRNRGNKPVRAVIHTHSHVDHFGGVLGVTTADDVLGGLVDVVAPAEFAHHAVAENVIAGPVMRRRAVYMYGVGVPAGPEGAVGFGLGQATSGGASGMLQPTLTITETGQEAGAGVRFAFQMTPDTEAPSEMNFYLPDRKVLLIAENVNHTLHNVLTLRGALVRDAHRWAGYITESIQLYPEAEILMGSHHWPTWGRSAILQLLTEQRDAYAYLHDQTVRLMNNGLTGAEIAEELTEYPGELGRAWNARGYYGSLSHNAKAIYQRYMGWYDGNPAHLWQLPPVQQGTRYVKAIGGAEAVLAQGRAALEEGELRWAAELLSHLVFAEPDNRDARELLAEVLTRLGFGSENGTWRNIYLSGAKELRAQHPRSGAGIPTTTDMLAGLSTGELFASLAIRVNGPRAAAHRLLLRWEFTTPAGGPELWTVLLGNGVLTPMRGDAPAGESPQLTVRLERALFDRILAGLTTFEDQVAAGEVVLEGDAALLGTLFGLLEEPVAHFPVVLP